MSPRRCRGAARATRCDVGCADRGVADGRGIGGTSGEKVDGGVEGVEGEEETIGEPAVEGSLVLMKCDAPRERRASRWAAGEGG